MRLRRRLLRASGATVLLLSTVPAAHAAPTDAALPRLQREQAQAALVLQRQQQRYGEQLAPLSIPQWLDLQQRNARQRSWQGQLLQREQQEQQILNRRSGDPPAPVTPAPDSRWQREQGAQDLRFRMERPGWPFPRARE